MNRRGIDAGNYGLKAVGDNEELEIVGAIAGYSPPKYTTKMNSHDQGIDLSRLAVEHEGKKYLIGPKAMKRQDCRQTVSSDRIVGADGKLLLALGLAMTASYRKEDVKLVVGLPLQNHTPEMCDKYQKIALGEHHISFLDDLTGNTIGEVSVNVTDVESIPQVFGAYLSRGG